MLGQDFQSLNTVKEKQETRVLIFFVFFFFTKVQKFPYDKYINEIFPKKY